MIEYYVKVSKNHDRFHNGTRTVIPDGNNSDEGAKGMSSRRKETLIRILAGFLCFFLAIGNMNQPIIRAEAIQTEAEEQKVLECRFESHTHTDSCYKDGKLICGMSTEYFHTHSEACYDDQGELTCPLNERNRHRHTEACYARTETLTCGMEEGEGGHQHTDACYTTVRTDDPACGLEENDGHTHGEDCWADCLICELEESNGHVHTDECLQTTLTCGMEEGEGAHIHGEGCYGLTCGLEESDGHVHGDECRDAEGNLICGIEEGEGDHHHTEECVGLICGLEETEGHRHSDECYTTEIICGIEEGEGAHTHSEQCYERRMVCEKDEIPAHHHTEECYPEIRVLTCELEETEGHIHTPECYETTEELTCLYAGIHEHTDACFETDENGRRICVCGYLEMSEHRHDKGCFRVTQAEDEVDPEDSADIQGAADPAEDEATDGADPEDSGTEETNPEDGGTEETVAVAGQNNAEDSETADSKTVDGETGESETAESIAEAEKEAFTTPVVLMQATEMECIATDETMPALFAAEFPGTEGEGSGTVSAGDGDSVYNAYEKGLLPAVRDQGNEGTCWAFASIGSVEACLIVKNLVGTDVDLSELHLAYFTAHPYADPKNGNTGDTVEYHGGESYLDNGGNEEMAYRSMANMVGVVNESDAPYTDKDNYNPDTAEALNKDAVQLVGAYLINPKDTKSIKNAIKTYGAVYAGIYAQAYTYYSNTYNSYYSTVGRTNHAVMLVGWNDDYPATNFNEAYRPSKNGAWLARNSWGYDGYAFSGYFWLSYEDMSLMSNESLTAYDAEYKTYDYCYAYDSTPTPEAKHEASQTATVSQKFRVDGGETIQAVGFETGTANLTASISLTDGSTTVTGSKKTTFAGFYLVKLNKPLAVSNTKEVTLTITYTGSGKIRIVSEAVGRDTTGNIVYTGAMGGQGFTLNGTHYDEDARMKLYTTKTGGSGLVEVSSVKLNKSSLTMEQSTTAQLTATVLPANASNQEITWSSSDTQTATVNSNGLVTSTPYGGEATITAMARNGQYATCKVKVNVVYVPVESVEIQGLVDRNPFVIDPETYPDFDNSIPLWLKYKLLPARATNKDVSWSSSDTSVATVDKDGKVLFKKNGTVTITITASDGKKDQVTIQLSAIRVPVTGVRISETAVVIKEEGSKQLTATVYPEDATDKTVTWSSSNPAAATVADDGTVTGVATGTTTITATTNEKDGKKTASCTVTVQPADLTLQGVSLSGTILKAGEKITGSALAGKGKPTSWRFRLQKMDPSTGKYSNVPSADISTEVNEFAFTPEAGAYRVYAEATDGYSKGTAYSTPFTVQHEGVSFGIEDIAYNPDPAVAGEEVSIMPGLSEGFLPLVQAYYYIYSQADEVIASFATNGSEGTFIPMDAGVYKVMVVVTDGNNWAAKWGKPMTVEPAPTLEITEIAMNGESPFTKFTPIELTIETENGEPSAYIYEVFYFDTLFMSNTSTEDHYTFRPNASGEYKIMAVCTDGIQWASRWSDPIYVYDTVPLTLSLEAEKKRVPLNGDVGIRMHYSGGNGVTFTEYQLWNTGTGQIVETWAGNDGRHTFTIPAVGAYRVMGVIHDSETWVASWSEELTCFDSLPLKLAGTTPDINYAKAGQFVTFTTECTAGEPTHYYYQLYNGETNALIHTEESDSATFRYAFPAQGTYKIMTVATDGTWWDAVWGTASVTVSDPAKLAITGVNIEGGTSKKYYEPFTVVPELNGAKKATILYYEVYDDTGKMVSKTSGQEGSFTYMPPTTTKSKYFRVYVVATNGTNWTGNMSDLIRYSDR